MTNSHKSNNFYVTTPIFYPTGVPHIGTAYNVFIADALARYHRSQARDTFFLTGTDEHGANIAKKAEDEGVSPQEFVDRYADIYRNIWQELGITNDYFVQTTDPRHEKFAQELIQKSYDNGDIYEGSYEGWYCESCEAYIKEEDLVDGKCPNHPTKQPTYTKEKNYYFRWSKYQDWLLKYYEEHPDFVKPERWFEYAKGFVQAGLQDIPVTRANVKWGVSVPFDPEQTIYVWYDALPNYLSTLNFPEFAAQGYEDKFWPEAVHVIGKDIIKFHAILWPAMLHSAGYQPPKTILTHGFFTVNGQKIGKSNNNAIDPVELAAKYSTDAVRYALLSEFQVGNDGDFSFERLEAKYKSDLANNWGNLLNRVIHLSSSKGIVIPTQYDTDALDQTIVDKVSQAEKAYHQHFASLELFEAVSIPNDLADFGNKYIAEAKPWEKDVPAETVEKVLLSLQYLLRSVANLYLPFLPTSATKSLEALQAQEKVILFEKLD